MTPERFKIAMECLGLVIGMVAFWACMFALLRGCNKAGKDER
jgi:hypothetical protein